MGVEYRVCAGEYNDFAAMDNPMDMGIRGVDRNYRSSSESDEAKIVTERKLKAFAMKCVAPPNLWEAAGKSLA